MQLVLELGTIVAYDETRSGYLDELCGRSGEGWMYT